MPIMNPDTLREICFVIMPFSETTQEHTEEYWAKHFESFLKILIEENPNLRAKRSDPMRGDILRQIISDLVTSRVVVADLTDHNPNVYWELGVRQSFKHGTVTIAEESTELPFDIGGKGTLFYNPKNHLEMEEFRKRFKETLQDCLEHPDIPDSHVLETISGRGSLFEILHRDEARRRLDALLSECDKNLEYLNDISNYASENQKNPDNRTYFTPRLRSGSLDLLIINRYIDEDDSFFQQVERCADDVTKINEQLNIWEHKPDITENWLLKYVKKSEKRFQELKDKIETVRNKISMRF